MSVEESGFPGGPSDATPGVDAGKIALRDDADAVRLGIGRYTVDLVARGAQVLAIVGRGVGSPPTKLSLPIGAAAVLVELADTADARTAWRTAAWPLCVSVGG